MLATALGGAAIAVGTSMRALDCAEVELGVASKPAAMAAIVVFLAILGFVFQFKVQPKTVRERDGLEAAQCA